MREETKLRVSHCQWSVYLRIKISFCCTAVGRLGERSPQSLTCPHSGADSTIACISPSLVTSALAAQLVEDS